MTYQKKLNKKTNRKKQNKTNKQIIEQTSKQKYVQQNTRHTVPIKQTDKQVHKETAFVWILMLNV